MGNKFHEDVGYYSALIVNSLMGGTLEELRKHLFEFQCKYDLTEREAAEIIDDTLVKLTGHHLLELTPEIIIQAQNDFAKNQKLEKRMRNLGFNWFDFN